MTDDLLKRAEPFLNVCGACDLGMPTLCNCPTGDSRPVMAARREAVAADNLKLHNDLANMNREAIGEAQAGDLRSLVTRWMLRLSSTLPVEHEARRGSDVEAWIKQRRDRLVNMVGRKLDGWYELDDLLEDYREHSDTGAPLGQSLIGPHSEDA